jgi:hypothetical protein
MSSRSGTALTLNKWLKRKLPKNASLIQWPANFTPIHWTVKQQVHWKSLLRSSQHFGVQRICFPLIYGIPPAIEIYRCTGFYGPFDSGKKIEIVIGEVLQRNQIFLLKKAVIETKYRNCSID